MKQIDCIKCRVNYAYKLYSHRKEISRLEDIINKQREQIEQYERVMKTDDDLRCLDMDDDEKLNDMFPDKEDE